MATQYFVQTVDLGTDEQAVEGPFPTEVAAIACAESRAEDFYGGDDVTWCQGGPLTGYLVGRILEGGEYSDPLVMITVEEEDVEIEEDPTLPDSDAQDEESSPASPIIPGNVGSLDDVPSDVMEGRKGPEST